MQFKTAFLVVSNTGSVDSWHCGKCNHVGRAPIMRRLGSWPLLKICRRVTACLDSPNMSHSFTQNRCWTTLQAPQHEGWKTCVKNGRLNQFFEAPETVWWLGPTDPTLPPDFTTDLCCRLLVISGTRDLTFSQEGAPRNRHISQYLKFQEILESVYHQLVASFMMFSESPTQRKSTCLFGW